MNHTFSAPVTAAQRQRDTLLGTLVGWRAPRSMNPKRRTLTAYWLPVCGWRLTPRPPRARCSG